MLVDEPVSQRDIRRAAAAEPAQRLTGQRPGPRIERSARSTRQEQLRVGVVDHAHLCRPSVLDRPGHRHRLGGKTRAFLESMGERCPQVSHLPIMNHRQHRCLRWRSPRPTRNRLTRAFRSRPRRNRSGSHRSSFGTPTVRSGRPPLHSLTRSRPALRPRAAPGPPPRSESRARSARCLGVDSTRR